jgi:hypothetical protein
MLSGLLGAPINELINLLANSANYRSFVSVGTVEAAKARIYKLLQDPSTATWPLAILTYTDGDWRAERDAEGGGVGNFNIDSSLTLIFEKNTDDYQADLDAFVNVVSAILTDIMNISGSGDFLRISGIGLVGFFESDTGGPKRLQGVFKISWGI